MIEGVRFYCHPYFTDADTDVSNNEKLSLARTVQYTRASFLNLCAADIVGQITFCGGGTCLVYCSTDGSLPGCR